MNFTLGVPEIVDGIDKMQLIWQKEVKCKISWELRERKNIAVFLEKQIL